jgi:hypothetical protein
VRWRQAPLRNGSGLQWGLVWAEPSGALKGRCPSAQGNALGTRSPPSQHPVRVQQPHLTHRPMSHPVRALDRGPRSPQSVALGWYVLPFEGRSTTACRRLQAVVRWRQAPLRGRGPWAVGVVDDHGSADAKTFPFGLALEGRLCRMHWTHTKDPASPDAYPPVNPTPLRPRVIDFTRWVLFPGSALIVRMSFFLVPAPSFLFTVTGASCSALAGSRESGPG